MVVSLSSSSVRYIKNGEGGQWWPDAMANGRIYARWSAVPEDLLKNPGDYSAIKAHMDADATYKNPSSRTNDMKQLRDLLDNPSRHIWITFEDGCMWWCTSKDGIETDPQSDDGKTPRFWLTCNLPWSNHSLRERRLSIVDLPGSVTRTAGFKGTVCTPQDWQGVLRLITGEQNPNVAASTRAREAYEDAIGRILSQLSWQDFEQLVDLILARTAWTRISTLGKTQAHIDLEAQNLAADEIAFVQVKSVSNQSELDRYVERFKNQRERYARMIFAVHTSQGTLTAPADLPVQIWGEDRLVKLVVRLGLAEWVEHRLG